MNIFNNSFRLIALAFLAINFGAFGMDSNGMDSDGWNIVLSKKDKREHARAVAYAKAQQEQARAEAQRQQAQAKVLQQEQARTEALQKAQADELERLADKLDFGVAADNDRWDLVQILLDKKRGNVNSLGGPYNATALHVAVINDDREMIDSLIARGADTTIKNSYGLTALDLAKDFKVEVPQYVSNKLQLKSKCSIQ